MLVTGGAGFLGVLHVEGLAREIGVDPTGLVETIRVQNEFARTGVDTDFGKGWGATGTAMTLAAR